MSDNKIMVLCGKSSCGKDSLQWKLKEVLDYNVIVSVTSRPMRPGEKNGVNYHYVNNEEFERMISAGELIEYRAYHTTVGGVPATWYYGCAYRDVDASKNNVIVLDPIGLRGFKEHFGDKVISFYIDSPDELREIRAKQRGGFDKTEWDRRMEDDANIFDNKFIYEEADFILYNGSNNKIGDLVQDAVRCLTDTKESLMVEYNLRLVHHTIKHYKLDFLDDYDDLFQVGSIGLLSAVRNFDKEKGVKFSTFAVFCIKGAITTHYGSPKRRNDLLKTAISLDAPINEGTENTLHDTLTSEQFEINENINKEQTKKTVAAILEEIEDPKDRELVELHFLKQKSLRSLGKEYGMSHEAIRRRINKAVKETRTARNLLDNA